MDTPDIIELIDRINHGLDIVIPIALGIGIIAVILIYTRNKISGDGVVKGLYLGILAFIEAGIIVTIIYYLPQILEIFLRNAISTSTLRWIIIYLIIPIWYLSTRKNNGWRGATSVFIILTVFLIGWLYERWIGIIIISFPVLAIFIHVINKIAQIMLPTSDPESKTEARQKTRAFIVYLLGIQHPTWVVGAKAERGFEKRLTGDTTQSLGIPGIIWTWSHQVAGISKGIEFNRVEGPGIVFTKQYEYPLALIDLRTQIRVSTVNTITKDGMEIPAIVFAAFAIDKEAWPKDGWSKAFFSKLKFLTGKNFEIDHGDGSYPYSSGRIRSALSTSGINNTVQSEAEKAEFFWDDWVVKQIEHATRQVISDRSLDELWRPRNDGLGCSALDETAIELKRLLSPKLAEAGINLYAARIVNYDIKEDSQIAQQNIKTWSSYWEQRITEANADIEIVYREEIEKAHAYSKSILLSAVADSIAKAREIHKDLPRHVIAQYYVHALEEYIKKQPGLDVVESKQRLENIKEFLMFNRTEGNE